MEHPARQEGVRDQRGVLSGERCAGRQPGLYNGFLAAGLVWALVSDDPVGFQASVFFLVCVIVAGLYGAATVNRRILLVQAVPAAVALALVLAAG